MARKRLVDLKDLVAKADTDGNGLVSKREYLDAIAAELADQSGEDLPEGAVPEAEAEGDEGA